MVHLITPLTEVAGFHDGDMDGLHAYPGYDRDQNQAEHAGFPDVNPDDQILYVVSNFIIILSVANTIIATIHS